MKNVGLNVKEKLISKYLVKDPSKSSPKSSNINVLLNRIEVNKKTKLEKNFISLAAASTGLLLFGLIIF